MKKKYDQEAKKAREYKKKMDQLEMENKVLRNKVKNLSGRRRGRKDDKRLRQLIRENRELRKRLRKLMKELDKRRRWYNRATRIFKNNQDKWIKAQRNAWKDKKFIIKYVFLDDVKYIKQYQKPRRGRDKIQFKKIMRFKTTGGGETTVKGVEIVVMDADDDGASDSDDDEYEVDADGKRKKKKRKKKGGDGDGDGDEEETKEDGDGKKKKKKKKKKSAFEEEEEIEQYLNEMMAEFKIATEELQEDEEDLPSDIEDEDDEEDADDDDDDLDDNADDFGGKSQQESGDEDSESEENTAEAQLLYVRQEMDERANDLQKLKEIMGDTEKYPDPQQEIERLLNEDIGDRHNEMVSNLEGLNCDTNPVKQSNDEWKQYILNLSRTIAGNNTMLNQMMNILNDGFLKELNGRIGDLNGINNVYYEEQDADFNVLKEGVKQRHGEISTDVQSSREEMVKQVDGSDEDTRDEDAGDDDVGNSQLKQMISLYDGLLGTNTSWDELMQNCSTMHTESQNAKIHLVDQLMMQYDKVEQLVGKVDQLPATKLL